MASGIYQIRSRINGRRYVGASGNFAMRWHRHRKDLGKQAHTCPLLQEDWDRFGPDAFEFSVLEVMSELDRRRTERERHWAARLKPEYNVICPTGEPCCVFIAAQFPTRLAEFARQQAAAAGVTVPAYLRSLVEADYQRNNRST